MQLFYQLLFLSHLPIYCCFFSDRAYPDWIDTGYYAKIKKDIFPIEARYQHGILYLKIVKNTSLDRPLDEEQISFFKNITKNGFHLSYIGQPRDNTILSFTSNHLQMEFWKSMGQSPYLSLLENIHTDIMNIFYQVGVQYRPTIYVEDQEEVFTLLMDSAQKAIHKTLEKDFEKTYYLNVWSEVMYSFYDKNKLVDAFVQKQKELHESISNQIYSLDKKWLNKLVSYLQQTYYPLRSSSLSKT